MQFMKVLVDALPLTGLLTGIARYLRNLYGEMARLAEVELAYYTGRGVERVMPSLADPVKWSKATAAIWRLPDPAVFALRALHWLRYEHGLRGVCRNHSFDLYHETAFVPAKLPSLPMVYSIYDLSLRRYRQTHPRERVWFFEFFLKRRLPYATHILTISEFIRQEVLAEFNLPASMVSAVPLAADPVFSPQSPAEVVRVRGRYRLPENYLLFVGSLEPRKNISLVIKAMQAGRDDIPLVLTGWQGWGDKAWLEEARAAGLARRLFFTGYVPDADLAALYQGATALVYPSLYEGFGLPIVEAMAVGCPVICSRAASMPEVAGEAALLIDPRRSEELAAAIATVTGESAAAAELRQRGFCQAARFSWERTARETLAVFQKVAGGEE